MADFQVYLNSQQQSFVCINLLLFTFTKYLYSALQGTYSDALSALAYTMLNINMNKYFQSISKTNCQRKTSISFRLLN